MASQTLTQTQQSWSPSTLAGTWKLAGRRAVTLCPREAGVVRAVQGRLWATFDGPHRGPRNDLGDHVLGAGEQLRLRAGQRLVVESWNPGSPSYFSWDPLPAAGAAPRLAAALQPLADLRLALALGADAVRRLVVGLAGLAWQSLRGRGRERLADGAFAGPSGACRAGS